MKIRHPLIKELQRKIEKTYALDTGITNIEQYIIGDKGYKEFYAKENIRTVVKSHSGAKVLIRDAGDTLKVSIYYPDELIRKLEGNDPRLGLHDDNIDLCASFVEELDHFLEHCTPNCGRLKSFVHLKFNPSQRLKIPEIGRSL